MPPNATISTQRNGVPSALSACHAKPGRQEGNPIPRSLFFKGKMKAPRVALFRFNELISARTCTHTHIPKLLKIKRQKNYQDVYHACSLVTAHFGLFYLPFLFPIVALYYFSNRKNITLKNPLPFSSSSFPLTQISMKMHLDWSEGPGSTRCFHGKGGRRLCFQGFLGLLYFFFSLLRNVSVTSCPEK